MESMKIVPKEIRKSIKGGHYPGVFADWLVYGLRARKALRLNQESLSLEQKAVLVAYAVSNLRKSVAFFASFVPGAVYVVYTEIFPEQHSTSNFYVWVAATVLCAFLGWRLSKKPLTAFVQNTPVS
jgi:hypothetical protein